MCTSNWYKTRNRRQSKGVDEKCVVELVKSERQIQPRIGGRKLLHILTPKLKKAGIRLGRDRFFDILKKHDLLVQPLPRSSKTTYSNHTLPIFHNKIKGRSPDAPNQVWVSDITYIKTSNSFLYLSLIMDLYSRKIVGYHCGDTLEATGCIKSLKMALKQLPKNSRITHHSDRGCQYCSHGYLKYLEGHEISMTEKDHCAENSHAERLNGILKQEYALGNTIVDSSIAKRAVDQAIWIYNHKRPHTKLELKVPAEVHQKVA